MYGEQQLAILMRASNTVSHAGTLLPPDSSTPLHAALLASSAFQPDSASGSLASNINLQSQDSAYNVRIYGVPVRPPFKMACVGPANMHLTVLYGLTSHSWLHVMLHIHPQVILLIGLHLPTYFTLATPKQHLERSFAMGVCRVI